MRQQRTLGGRDRAAVPHAGKGAPCSAWSPGCSKAAGFSKLALSGARPEPRKLEGVPTSAPAPPALRLLKSWCRPHAIPVSLPLTQLVLLSASVMPRGPPAAGECRLDSISEGRESFQES